MLKLVFDLDGLLRTRFHVEPKFCLTSVVYVTPSHVWEAKRKTKNLKTHDRLCQKLGQMKPNIIPPHATQQSQCSGHVWLSWSHKKNIFAIPLSAPKTELWCWISCWELKWIDKMSPGVFWLHAGAQMQIFAFFHILLLSAERCQAKAASSCSSHSTMCGAPPRWAGGLQLLELAPVEAQQDNSFWCHTHTHTQIDEILLQFHICSHSKLEDIKKVILSEWKKVKDEMTSVFLLSAWNAFAIDFCCKIAPGDFPFLHIELQTDQAKQKSFMSSNEASSRADPVPDGSHDSLPTVFPHVCFSSLKQRKYVEAHMIFSIDSFKKLQLYFSTCFIDSTVASSVFQKSWGLILNECSEQISTQSLLVRQSVKIKRIEDQEIHNYLLKKQVLLYSK